MRNVASRDRVAAGRGSIAQQTNKYCNYIVELLLKSYQIPSRFIIKFSSPT